jgi:hypothetical protein
MTEITREDGICKESHELQGLRLQKEKIEAFYRQIFPKVDPYRIHDLLLRMDENSKIKTKDLCTP